ncbi:hypothetical protein CRG98_043327 [Punica granatum]|uniref:Uncharacterized protein n=1 Tax=Punica granatum TaxID=22663 RepID=A0A2I0HX83_PUNGR|nr:hypothetical protein CRG98_043327 [Punica granatum]
MASLILSTGASSAALLGPPTTSPLSGVPSSIFHSKRRPAEPEVDVQTLQIPSFTEMARTREHSPLTFLADSHADNLGSYYRRDFELTSRKAEPDAESQVLHDPPRAGMAYTLEGSPLMFPAEPRDANTGHYYCRDANLLSFEVSFFPFAFSAFLG